MTNKIIFMFSGQGSHYYQMGRSLYNDNSLFRQHLDRIDALIRQQSQRSIVEYIYDGSKRLGENFKEIHYSHPAIFAIEYALAQTLIDNGVVPHYVLGASLGEFTAAAIAGVLDAETIISIILKQANALHSSCAEGGMIAIVDRHDLYFQEAVIRENSELVGKNYDSHFVIAGESDKLKEVEVLLKKKNIVYQVLPVAQGFHSYAIDKAYDMFMQSLSSLHCKGPQIPILSCLTAGQKDDFDKQFFWDIVRSPILFQETIQYAESIGQNAYIDVGPSGTLANFVKYNINEKSKSKIYILLSPMNKNSSQALDKIIKSTIHNNSNNLNKRQVKNMKAYVFPGQGSQKKGMGEKLFDEFPEYTKQADEILGYSIKDLCLNDPDDQLSNTKFTQPALYVVSALTYLKKQQQEQEKPAYVAGHSLGEYSALFAAGAYDFATGLKLVQKRGDIMSKIKDGAMAAVIGLDSSAVEAILKDNNLTAIDVANFNSPFQIVISGTNDVIEKAKPIFEKNGAKMYIPLKVSGAFHSRYMEAAAKEYDAFINTITFSPLDIPVISNVYARPYENDQIKEVLVKQITHSVKWTETIQYLMGKDVSAYEEIGPGNVLTGLIAKIQKEAEPLKVADKVSENVTAVESKTEKKSKETTVTFYKITPQSLGSKEYREDYKIKYAYVSGAMFRGVASKELVVKMGKSGLMGYLGTGGLGLDQIEESIQYIQKELHNGESYGMNLLCNIQEPEVEERTVDLYIKYGIKHIEAAAYMQITPALVKYRLQGLSKDAHGNIVIGNKVQAKVSRPEVAKGFLSPAPERIIKRLLEEGKISQEQADLAQAIPMADDICVEADSGGHTDMGVLTNLLPAISKLRDELVQSFNYKKKIRVGAAGGIGTPEAAAAAFMLGADFIVTGSINQCSVEAGTSDAVKDLLEKINVQDTDYAPAGDMFEVGAKVQVLKKGVFFASRANKLYELYRQFNSIDEIDEKTRTQLQEKYFKRSFDDIYNETKSYFMKRNPAEIEKAEKNPKHKMALIFRWYFSYCSRLALTGDTANQVDFQVHCGPALGAFNQWVKGTDLEKWQNRHVDLIAEKLMQETASLVNERYQSFINEGL